MGDHVDPGSEVGEGRVVPDRASTEADAEECECCSDQMVDGGRRPPDHLKFSEMFRIAGPIITTKMAGKMQNTMGTSILTGAFCARS